MNNWKNCFHICFAPHRQKEIEDIEREKIRLEEEEMTKAEEKARLQAERLLEAERQELVIRAQELKAAKAAEDLKVTIKDEL